ncbi:MAG: helix-turn-helix transcriptional regulator [bacterium]|nr:helix-turn-helix transcriptional regulator [bacterium]
MNTAPRQRYEARAKIAKALAHPTRLLFLDALKQQGELCVCELTELAGADQSTVSKHLAILKDTGLVGVRKYRSMSYYSLKCQCLEGFFSCIETVLAENLRAQQELVSLKTVP